MKDKRPVNLDLTQFSFPLPALTSIVHRVTGVALFVGVAILMYVLELSLSSEDGFNAAKECLDGAFVTLIMWGLVSALLYHLVAGIKHLLMDCGIGETLEAGQFGAKVVIAVSVVLILLAGVWLW
ncbi:succinate dehydrogenase, cytochrome b556 subunit [Oleiphilus sp. HI0081]|uniref:succinate dehydrogenase, cytochrome b556 subunit n=1 Tax=unclassified Oleiphilus TaxID=2631174 RepID=UPI0007C2F84C|nr:MULTISPECIES: succinate dehydrogenase, cytochrome b556 subunit [unclassified Oleiphilus]KZY77267.1 succinate dehydrogenase, cytochrome b556 subunit [Oleiphilus sp. HI0068]KZY85659.1 succinate dehydrogenase, cytochrome b556 subunit [Oleiphilus sp. HI0069]KZY88358.1 succinate dehydrogenase, cytochrome b556 subunit [Oleiphilus sp. HI0072]KZZ07984.1 succinate dehydrogenase, cytochrome b556 subunit [Oleiphilus sp. HI0078]KZZ19305.1 succinate dehydrogenase, cytochrome b556 subunit [Oleiphilus sp.